MNGKDAREEEPDAGVEHRCSGCGDGGRKLDLRPVMVEGQDKPRPLCPECYSVLESFDLIDHERDAEVFGYAE